MASGSEKYSGINKGRQARSKASKRGSTMQDIGRRNNASNTPF